MSDLVLYDAFTNKPVPNPRLALMSTVGSLSVPLRFRVLLNHERRSGQGQHLRH
jgi:hypothetical protein